jgi:uncharacterized protein
MDLRRSVVTALVAGTLLVTVAACGDDDAPDGGNGTGIANPASVFCEEQGGTVEIVDEAGGQVGYCNLPDGTRIEEWEYYRSRNLDQVEAE